MDNHELMDLQISRIRDFGLDEKWLQERIEENPSIIGLGDVIIIKRERRQSSGGRLDFLLSDPENNIMYEVEVMLGKLDESHIIRSIEYWDLENRRFPNKEHKAVIIAEEITNRFFNVISLMNKSIPVVAIQLSAIKNENKIGLLFTKVLDVYETPEDELELEAEEIDRNYWEKKSNPTTMSIIDQIIAHSKEQYGNLKITYNKYHIALGTAVRNNIWLHPRRRHGHCYIELIVGEDNVDEVIKMLEDNSISYRKTGDESFGISIQEKVFKEKTEVFFRIIETSIKAYS